MPRIPNATHVRCPSCNSIQQDLGKRNSCSQCGLQPIPSYSYPRGSMFHPSEQTLDRIVRQVAAARAAQPKTP